MLHNYTKNSVLLTIVVLFLSLGLSVSSPAQDNTIPIPGDETAIPLPDEDSQIPVPSPTAGELSFSFDVRGYVENATTVEYLKATEEEMTLNASRVRLDLSGEPNESIDFGIGLVGTMNRGATGVSLLNYCPDDVQTQIIPGAEGAFEYHIKKDDLFVQEAFGTLYSDHFRLRVGRHKFYTGTGYAYNPIDLFNLKDPLDPTYETNGIDALLLTLDLPRQTQLQGLVRYNDRFSTSDYLARLKTHISRWDAVLQYTRYLKERIDWEALNTEAALVEMMQGSSINDYTRKFYWHLFAAEFSGEVLGFGVYGEGGYVFIDKPNAVGTLEDAAKDHERLLLGVDRTFEFQLYFLIEYLRIGQGRTDSGNITLNDRMAYFNGEILSIDQDTLFIGVSYPLTDLLEGSLYAIVGLNDSNTILNPWLIYDLRPGLKLSLSANVPLGDEEGQNGKSGASGFARLKFHF